MKIEARINGDRREYELEGPVEHFASPDDELLHFEGQDKTVVLMRSLVEDLVIYPDPADLEAALEKRLEQKLRRYINERVGRCIDERVDKSWTMLPRLEFSQGEGPSCDESDSPLPWWRRIFG